MTFNINLDKITELECFQEASREELRILLSLASLGGRIVSIEDLARVSGVSVARCRSTLVLWEECGVIAEADGEIIIDEFAERRSSEERYNKPATEVARNVRDGEMAEFLNECATLMGKPALNPEEIKDLEYILTDMGVSKEFVLILIAHLLGRKKTVTPRNVLTEVERLAKKNIDTAEALEVYISKLEKTSANEREFSNRFQIWHPLSELELSFVDKWMDDFGFGIEIISAAYSIATKTITSNVPFSRLDRILTAWHEAGCKTVSECLSKGEEYRKEKQKKTREKADRDAADKITAPNGKKPSTTREANAKFNDFDTEDALMAALKRSYGEPDGGEN